MFESNDRLVFIEYSAPKLRIPFIKGCEAGHGPVAHQCKTYKLIYDYEQTVDLYITDLFEQEGNGLCLLHR